MRLNKDILLYLNKSVLCWLATCSLDGVPNVSPKEAFCVYGEEIIIANIASPQSQRNIENNPKVCLSFVDVLVQKGYQLHGTARCVGSKDSLFPELKALLEATTCGKYPFESVFLIHIEKAKPIIAPSYLLYPKETSEEKQIENARKQYGLS